MLTISRLIIASVAAASFVALFAGCRRAASATSATDSGETDVVLEVDIKVWSQSLLEELANTLPRLKQLGIDRLRFRTDTAMNRFDAVDDLVRRLGMAIDTTTPSDDDIVYVDGPWIAADSADVLLGAKAVVDYTTAGKTPVIRISDANGLGVLSAVADGSLRSAYSTVGDYATFYRKLNHLRHTQPSLASGRDDVVSTVYHVTAPGLRIYSYSADRHTLLVMVNLSTEMQPVVYTGKAPVLDETTVDFFTATASPLPHQLGPGEFRIYVSR